MGNNKFNPEVAKELYNEAASIGKTSIPEEDFYQNLGDSEYARMVYRRYKDKYGVNLLGAEDDSSFLGSLGYTTDYVGNKPMEKKETTPKQEKPVRIPNIRTVKDDNTGEDMYVDIDVPKTPDMTLKLPNSMDRFKQNPLEDNLVKKVFGVERLADVKNPQERLQEQIAQLGKDKEEVRYDDEGNPFTVKIADSHKDLDIERIKNIRESIAQQQAYDRKINDDFVKKYELLKSKLTAEENYSPKESWAPRNLKPKNITEEDKEFLRVYADKYNKIKEARKALDNQSKFAKSYAQLAEYDASVEKGEQMSAMVAKGEISEDDMDILRSSKSQAASHQYIERQVKNGRISRVTANKLYEMGDLTERNAFSYGFTKTGNLEDLITFGITEIVRNFDVAAIANKVKNGQKLTDEEANVISMYGKMSDMLSEAKQDARGWQFTAGQGMQKTLLFIAEMGLTGGVSGLGKTFGKEAAKALVKKYGLKKASGIIAKQTGNRLAQSAKQQLFLTPLTPAAYVDYSDRVLKMTLDQPEVTTKDKIAALYKSYAQIWAERFSESLGDIVVDVPVGGLLSKTSFYKKAIEPVANIFNKITELPGYKNTSKTLRQFGVDNMPVEMFEETINPFLYSAATAFTDTKEIEQIDGDFFRQVALTSAILGGFHGALGYTVGASTAAIESKRIDNAYSDIMGKISKMKFLNKNMESLREELVVALNRQNYIESESGNKGRTVGQILGDMNAEMQSFAESDRNLATYKYDRRVFEAMDYASRVGAYKYGSNLGIKGEVSARLGRAKDEDGNIIPMDFEHKDGNVYEASVNGQNYFILDESNDAVVVVNRETGEKEILNKNVFDTSTITQTNANDWAMNTYLLNFKNWKAQDSQTQNQETQQGQPTTPPTHVVLRGEQLPIKNIDPETGEVTITDNTGDELTIPANDPEIELVYPTQQAEQAPAQQEEAPQQVSEENAPIEEPITTTEATEESEMQEPEYVAPRSEDNDIVWNEVPAERFKQVIDEEVGADYADGYIDMRIEDAQRKLNEHNKKQKPIASGEYKAFMEESKKLESNLAYWTNAKQEYANAVAQEVAAQNEVESLPQEEASDVAPESTVMYDAKQSEQTEAEVQTPLSKEELDSNVAGWKDNGVNVNVVNSIDDITNEQVLADMKKGVKVTGWYDTKTGEVYVFAPNLTDTSELDSTVIHEVVAHKGLRGLVGEKYYEQFCEKVFDSMPKELQDDYMAYPGVNGRKAAAADEYIAYLAEKEDLTAEEQSIWDKIIQFFREYFDARLVGILKKDNITDADIAQLIRMSYANIKNNANQEKATEDTAKQELNEEGFETDNTGTVRFSVKYVPDESLREKIISNLMAVTGDSREKVEKWLESELSLANIINDEMNRDVLDYEADDRYGAIKKNSDYPQGTVDFNNICRKRLDFTNIYKQLQSAYPNRIFTAEDLEAIRQTMIEDGLMVACGLCYVEDRRQLLGEIANDFIENLKNGTLKENIAELLDPEDTYIPTIADLLAPEGSKEFYNEHPALYNAFVKFNNARGQQAGRLFEGYAEYKREILKWNDKKVKSVNNVGGLRIFSFSDFEAHHLIDIVQIVIDAASKGVMIQGYTKVPTFARAMRNTGIKINRSLIPEGNGIKEVDGQLQLAFDPVEGIDVNDKDFLDEESNPNIGNVLVGINEEQIRMAMTDAFVDYIIPFHSGIRKDILDKKKIGHWVNYKNSQREKDLSTGKSAENGINIYTDVLQAAEAEGKPIKTKKQFVNKFLAVCKERGLEPRFSQFLDKDAKGNYVYTEGYHKFLVDFKLFDKKGKILPQQPVVPVFDNAFNAEILNNYVEDTKTTKEYGETVEKIKERLGLENNPRDPNNGPRYRTAVQKESLFEKAKEVFGTTNNFKVAGYMLPDGSLLDFSGRWEGGPGDARYTDHRAIGSGLYEASETDSNYDTNMYDFINQGAIRLMPESAGIYVSQPLTEKQEDRLSSYIYSNNGEVILEIIDNDGNSISYIEYNRRTSPEKVLTDISNYFDKGVVPVQPEVRYRTSAEIDKEYPNWLEGTTNESGKHSTQVTKTVGTYNKVGEWIENNLGKDVEILDASSGMGLGTQSLREKGFNIEDVEPYQSEDRKQNNPATYSAYADINKQYDYIISNAVLNVIPDDWRADVLHNMAARMKDGGKMFINTRKAGEEKSIKDKIELDTPQEVLVKRNGKIASYQKFFTPQELKSWVEQELGDGYTVEVANEKNSGTKGLAAVVVTKNNPTDPNGGPRYRIQNETFNKELERFQNGEMKSNEMFNLGTPQGAMQLFLPNLPIVMRQRVLRKGIEKKHNVDISSLRNMPSYIYEPIFIFKRDENSIGILTEITDRDGKNVCVAIELNKTIQDGGEFIEVNDIRSFHGRDVENIISPIAKKGTSALKWVDKEKGLSWLSSASQQVQQETVKEDLISASKIINEFVNPTIEEQKSFEARYRIPSTPAEARQRAEKIMKDAIAPMAAELGVEVNYVTTEDISDVEPGARKKRQSKGWYQDGKVYINLSTHETIDDARETYLHEVVAHYGLRGLLKDQFEPVMQKVFASLTPTQQQSLLEIFADEVEAAEEFLASMAENDIDPDIVDKVIGFIRDALRSMGINLDNYTNSDLMYLLWRSKNNLKENAGHIETARWEAKDTEVRYRTFKNGRLSANSQYGTVDRLIEKAKDTVWSVKLLQDEIVARGGLITDTSDPYGQSTLMPQRSAYEIGEFNISHYKPMIKVFSKAAKLLAKRKNISIYEANDAIEDFLYARHAVERNRKLAIDKMYAKAAGMFADLTKEQREQLKEISEAMYDAKYSSRPVVVEVVPYPNSNKLALSINGLYTDSHFSIDEFDTISTAIAEWTAENPEVNESGLTDKQAQDIIDDVYVNQSAQMQDMLDEVSKSIKDCTKFILDKWLEYGMISNSDYHKYLNQYDYYIPLRGWDETSDIEYEDVAGNEYNKGETLISLNRQARGRKSKADSPLAFIAQMATSAIVYGNKNRLKQMAFNMIRYNYDLIQDLVFIEDDDKLTHKTKSEIKAHEVQLKNDGRTVRFSFQKNFGVGVAAATAIKGDNVQNITNPIMRMVGSVTRLQSRLRTSWNPVFTVVNGVRDLFFGNLSYFIKYGLGDTIELNKNYAKGFACALLDAAGVPLGNSPLRQEYEEYKREGGQTGYIHLDDIKRLKRETRKIQRRYQNGWNRVSSSVLKLPSYVLRLLGEPGENAMRFAAYKTLRDKGVSSRQAAKAAKEITVNFNRTGTSKWPGMLWGFYNATLEGTANYFRMGFNKETAARFWMTNAALAAVSYVMAGWAKGFGDDDDDILEGMTDEERAEYMQQKEFANEYNRISNYVKRTNILIPMMGDNEEKKFIAIPLPQSFRMASALGITLRNIIENDKNALDELEELAWFVVGEIQPFDIENISIEKGDGFLSNLERVASPSIVLPWLEVEQNRNFMGNPIYKESYINESYNERIEPSYTIAGNQTPEFLIATAKEINEKLGGTEYMAAKENEKIAQNRQDARGLQYTLALMADAADPASVDHILKGTLGGFYELGVKAIDRYNSEEENTAEDWILADRFIKSATRKPGAEMYYERKKYADELERLMKNEKKNAKNGEANQYLNSPHHKELVKVNKYWKKRIKDITDKIATYKKGNVVNEEKITELKEQRDELVLKAALAFERLERKYKEQE